MSGEISNFVIIKNNFLYELEFLSYLGKIIFIYPFVGRSNREFAKYCAIHFLVFITSFQLFITLITNGFSDWFEIINVAPNLGVCAMTTLKYTKMQTNKRMYGKIFDHFKNDLFDVVSENSVEHKKIVEKYTAITKFVTRFIFYYSIPLTVVVDLFPRIVMVLETKVLERETQYLYPFDGWYPFDKVKWYYAAYIWESFMTAIVVYIYGFANNTHALYTSYICMELKILGKSIEELITPADLEDINERRNVKQIHDNIKKKLKVIIVRHQFLTEISAEFDNILGDGMLSNYFFGAVFICLTAFTATVIDNLYKSVRYFFMFMSLMVEIFYQCMIGQVLSDHSGNLAEAIYLADWTEADTETKKMLLFLMIRAQKPLEFTANGYLTMNLNTFSGICSLSYQMFNLLRTYYT